ncbi:hypothetical protein [Microtetraspora sp. NBRC 16547]|uniref:hypothetical protein n=1 Tax=Microtetraspora sp. NBRC 16547 TaxID=3030993 RepID=UPI0024A2DDEB|nr:hypothetical protein [Microtetraspora sp. NBRC 16547]GLW99652.1 hypothetical protein Misp02_37390 [Microtetraspora sp. NBRC 16547]
MRTYFEPEEIEEFEAAKDLLIRRCLAWADEHGMSADGMVLSAALDSRHRSRDGRLAYWDPRQVRRLLLEWIPRYVVAHRDVLDAAPESLLTLLRYLAASGLRDPRGATLAELEAAVAAVGAEYPAALADPLRQSIGKFWAQTALDNGVDLTDGRAFGRFQRDIEAGRVRYDSDVLDKLVRGRFLAPELDEERAFAQLPVTLPPPAELAEAAARSASARQLAVLAEWVGAEGRPLTTTGNLRLADARELAELLSTGEQELKVRSSTEMPRVNLMLSWAKKARLVRVAKGRLLRVAKAAPVIRDPEALWRRAFEAFFELGTAIGAPASAWAGSSMLVERFDEILPDVLASVYGMPSPVPVIRLQETVWLACEGQFWLDLREDPQREIWRRQVDRDLVAALEALSDLGAVELSHGVADETYSSDLGDHLGEEERTLPPEVCARLLSHLAEPGLLVRLTPLGVRAMRERMLAEGRHVPLVGEMADASSAELLGVLAEHYTLETSATELEGWLSVHGRSVESLLDAIRACPFRTRAAAMLATLVEVRGRSMMAGLRRDPVLGPLAVTALLDAGELALEDLTPEEHLALMTEGLLALLELSGPEEVVQQLTEMAGKDALGAIEAVLNSGHPAEVSMRELRTLVAEPMRARTHRLRRVPSPAPGSRGRRSGHGKKRKH